MPPNIGYASAVATRFHVRGRIGPAGVPVLSKEAAATLKGRGSSD